MGGNAPSKRGGTNLFYMFYFIYVMVRGLQFPFVLYRIQSHINLVSWILFNSVKRPGIVVPDDPVIGIRIVITAVHLEKMGAFMLRCF